MKDIEQLIGALSQLQKQKEFDININIPVKNQAFFDCIQLNNIICETNNSPIKFCNNSFIFPHITLKMGTVNSNCFENIIIKLGDFTKTCRAIRISPLPVILKSPANKYYFSEIDEDSLIGISAELDKLLKDEMQLPRFPLSKDNLHHITLGYKYPNDLELAPVIGKTIAPFIAERIQVSIMGKFGVCIGVLKTFYLNESHH